MGYSVNSVQLLGNIGSDPEVRTTQNGSKVATFSLATSRTWKTAGGEKQEKTEWHRCVVWNPAGKNGLANVVEQYAKKGDKVFATGAIEYRQWQDKDNQTRYTTEINIKELVLLGGKDGTRTAVESDENDNDVGF